MESKRSAHLIDSFTKEHDHEKVKHTSIRIFYNVFNG